MTLLARLTALLGPDGVSTGASVREHYSHDESTHPSVLPEVVIHPASTDEVAAILALANETHTPVTPFGAGTSVEGNPIPVAGGIVMAFDRMERIVEYHEADLQVTVEPGVRRLQLERFLGERGTFFAPDPGADATIGGMIANNAAGIRSVRWGAVRDNVLAMTVVLADGSVIQTGSRSVKQSAGYDVRHLMIGSEGTLGVVTQATLGVVPIPEHVATAVVAFPDVHAATAAVAAIVAGSVDPDALELLDAWHVVTMNEDEGSVFEELPTLFIEVSGSSDVNERIATVRDRCASAGAVAIEVAEGQADAQRLRRLRHAVRERYSRRWRDVGMVTVDVSVPRSAFADLVRGVERLADEAGRSAPILGHAGDGNLHTTLTWPHGDRDEERATHQLADRIVALALSLDGTSTGEHGIGLGKRHHLESEFGAPTVAAMRAIKHALDPKGILNPGKVLP